MINTVCVFFSTLLDPPAIPELDLLFAISANAVKETENFQQMKDIIKAMIERYGTSSIQYAVITYGNVPITRISFNAAFLDDEALKSLVDSVRKSSGALLDSALAEAKSFFETQGRPNAKKVLVIIADKESSSSLNDVENQAKFLEEDDIKVIPVALGTESDLTELTVTTPNKENLVDVDEGDDPDETAEIIMLKALKGTQGLQYLRCVMLTFGNRQHCIVIPSGRLP